MVLAPVNHNAALLPFSCFTSQATSKGAAEEEKRRLISLLEEEKGKCADRYTMTCAAHLSCGHS